jgi:hypothetical protein
MFNMLKQSLRGLRPTKTKITMLASLGIAAVTLPFLAPQQGPEAPPPPPEGSQPLPVPAGRAAALQGAGAKGQAAAASITAKTPAEIKALEALATMRRMKTQIKGITGKPARKRNNAELGLSSPYTREGRTITQSRSRVARNRSARNFVD